MNKYLVYYYPAQPNTELRVYQLDALDVDKPVSKTYWEEVRQLYDMYKVALKHYPENTDKNVIAYNNSWWKIIEANSIFEAAALFENDLSAWIQRQAAHVDTKAMKKCIE